MTQTAIHKKIHDSKVFSDFMRDVVGASNNGRSMLLLLKQGWKNGIPTIIRCDDKADINREHDVNGKHYPDWTTVLDDLCAKKQTVYFTLNSFYGKNRSIVGLHSLQNLWVDIDDHSGENVSTARARGCVSTIVRRLERDNLPIPFAVFSGRGVHLFWPIINCGKEYLDRWNNVQKELQEYITGILEDDYSMANWEVDAKAADAARIIRMPGTFNYNAMKWSRFIKTNYTEPTALKVFEEFFCTEKQKNNIRDNKHIGDVRETGWSKRLAKARVMALMRFAEDRAMNIEGSRNTFTAILASCLLCSGEEDAQQRLLAFCRRLTPSQKDSEILTTFRSCEKNQYSWSNKTIIDRLGMSRTEEKRFRENTQKISAIKDLRKKKSNKTRDEKRAVQKKKKEGLYSRMPFLMAQGLSYSEIAIKLNISLSTVKRHAKEFLAKCKNRKVVRYRFKNILAAVKAAHQHKTETCAIYGEHGYKVKEKYSILFFDFLVSNWCVYKYSLRQRRKATVLMSCES